MLARPVVRAVLGETLRKKPGRLHFVRVTLAREGERFVASSTGNQSSGVLTSTVWGDGVVDNPAKHAIRRGDAVRFLPFSELLH